MPCGRARLCQGDDARGRVGGQARYALPSHPSHRKDAWWVWEDSNLRSSRGGFTVRALCRSGHTPNLVPALQGGWLSVAPSRGDLALPAGVEPATSGSTIRRSDQLSYGSKPGAVAGTRTRKGFPTSTSSWRVYHFRHDRERVPEPRRPPGAKRRAGVGRSQECLVRKAGLEPAWASRPASS